MTIPVGILELLQGVSGSFELAGQALIEGSHHISRQIAVMFCRANPGHNVALTSRQASRQRNAGSQSSNTAQRVACISQ